MNSCLDGLQKIREFGSTPVSKSPWSVSGRFFYQDGRIVRSKGFTSFKLLNLYDAGRDISPIIDQYPKANLARIFLYTPVSGWGSSSWGIPSVAGTIDFCHYMADRGIQVELTLCTDDDRSRIDQIKNLINLLKNQNITNLQLEAVNEPFISNKLNPDEFKNLLTGSGFLYTSGIYTDNKLFWGQYWNDHSPRSVPGWDGKGGHNLMEAYNGGGPNSGDEPALKIACREDEPIRPDQCSYDKLGFYSYAASCGLMGAGATFHSESAKLSNLLTQTELECSDFFFEGLDKFPLDSANGSYRRIKEPGQSETARTYVVGDYSIRIKQNGLDHPEEGWRSLDPYGICWSR